MACLFRNRYQRSYERCFMKSIVTIVITVIMFIVISCSIAGIPVNTLAEEQDEDTVISEETERVMPTTTNTPHQENSPTATVDAPATVENVVRQYYDSFIEKDYETVCSLISEYSLNLAGITRNDVMAELRKLDFQGYEFLDYEILETEELNEKTTLVHIMTKEQTADGDPQTFDFWVVVYQEDGQYRFNWGRIIDVWELDVEPQTVNDVTIQPIKMIRSTNELRLVIFMNNETQYNLFWGFGNEVVATFQVNDQSYDMRGSISLEANREYPDAAVWDQRLYREYPDTVELKNWKFDPSRSPGLPANRWNESWSYSFELK